MEHLILSVSSFDCTFAKTKLFLNLILYIDDIFFIFKLKCSKETVPTYCWALVLVICNNDKWRRGLEIKP